MNTMINFPVAEIPPREIYSNNKTQHSIEVNNIPFGNICVGEMLKATFYWIFKFLNANGSLPTEEITIKYSEWKANILWFARMLSW